MDGAMKEEREKEIKRMRRLKAWEDGGGGRKEMESLTVRTRTALLGAH